MGRSNEAVRETRHRLAHRLEQRTNDESGVEAAKTMSRLMVNRRVADRVQISNGKRLVESDLRACRQF
jgi:hypothetical protein